MPDPRIDREDTASSSAVSRSFGQAPDPASPDAGVACACSPGRPSPDVSAGASDASGLHHDTARVTAIIVNFHSAAMTLRAVRSLERQDMDDLDVVVVDNSECPEEAQCLQQHALAGRFRLLVNRRNEGFGRACNRAMADSDGEFLLLLNPDAWLRDGALAVLLGFLDRHPEAAAAGPRISMDDAGEMLLPPAGLPSPWGPVAHRLLVASHRLARRVSARARRRALTVLLAREPRAQRALSGAVVLLRRSAIERAGGLFDPAYFLYFEDSDLFRRLGAVGMKTFLVPGAGAVHHYDQCGRRLVSHKRALGERSWNVYLRRHDPRGRVRRVMRWLERLLPAPKLPELPTRAGNGAAPGGTIPGHDGAWALEISHNPWFLPAAVQLGRGSEARLSEQAWRLLADGDYYFRLGPVCGGGDFITWQARKCGESLRGGPVDPILGDAGLQSSGTEDAGFSLPAPRLPVPGPVVAHAAATVARGRRRVVALGTGAEVLAARIPGEGPPPVNLSPRNLGSRCASAGAVFDLAVVSRPPAAMDPVHWLSAIRALVSDDGELVLEGEFGREYDTVEGRLHGHEYLRSVARRAGWTVTDDRVLGPARGRTGGRGADRRLMHMIAAPAPTWSLGLAAAADFEQIARLFEDVFHRPLTRDYWRWKYADSGGAAVVARRGNELVAHYGGVPRRILFCGVAIEGVQVCDVMVQARERGVLTRNGPFMLTASTFVERYVGDGRPWALAFGFPNRRHASLGRRVGLYRDVAQVAEAAWRPLAGRPRPATRVRSFDAKRDAAAADLLWQAMAQDLGTAIVGVRDQAYLEYRYLQHPQRSYQLFTVSSRLTGSPLAVLVIRVDDGRCELLDVVAPLRRLPQAILQARRVSARLGARELYLWVTRHNVSRLPQDGLEVRDPGIVIPTITWRTGTDAVALRDRWWITGGDTDFR